MCGTESEVSLLYAGAAVFIAKSRRRETVCGKIHSLERLLLDLCKAAGVGLGGCLDLGNHHGAMDGVGTGNGIVPDPGNLSAQREMARAA